MIALLFWLVVAFLGYWLARPRRRRIVSARIRFCTTLWGRFCALLPLLDAEEDEMQRIKFNEQIGVTVEFLDKDGNVVPPDAGTTYAWSTKNAAAALIDPADAIPSKLKGQPAAGNADVTPVGFNCDCLLPDGRHLVPGESIEILGTAPPVSVITDARIALIGAPEPQV